MKTFRFSMLGIGGTRAATSYYHSVYVLTTDVCAVVYIYVLNACVTSELGANSFFTLDYHPETTDFNANLPTLVFCTVGSSSPVLSQHQSCGLIAAEKRLLVRGGHGRALFKYFLANFVPSTTAQAAGSCLVAVFLTNLPSNNSFESSILHYCSFCKSRHDSGGTSLLGEKVLCCPVLYTCKSSTAGSGHPISIT